MQNAEVEIVTIPVKNLKSIIKDEVHSALSGFFIDHTLTSLNGEQELLKRVDVAEMFDVSLPTIHSWMNAGILPFHRIGSRTFFKKQEVFDAMKKIKIRRK